MSKKMVDWSGDLELITKNGNKHHCKFLHYYLHSSCINHGEYAMVKISVDGGYDSVYVVDWYNGYKVKNMETGETHQSTKVVNVSQDDWRVVYVVAYSHEITTSLPCHDTLESAIDIGKESYERGVNVIGFLNKTNGVFITTEEALELY